tara:strand:+ start:4291 stop:4548 length:258 start_codon:yes stop_codon:yes gene_type:complete
MNLTIQFVKQFLNDKSSVSHETLKRNSLQAAHDLDVALLVASAAKSAYYSSRNSSNDPYHPDEDGCDARFSVKAYEKMTRGNKIL